MSSADVPEQELAYWSLERAPLHDTIVAAHLAGKKASVDGTPTVYFTAGGGASGRTGAVFSVGGREMTAAQLAHPATEQTDVVVVDPDRVSKLIPEFQLLREAGDSYAALGVRAESGSIARRIVAEAQRRRLSYLCYTTGSSPAFLDHIVATKAAGYETQVTMTSRPTNEAITRSMWRAEYSATDRGRYAHIGELKNAHAGASRNFKLWKDSPLVDKWSLYDTSKEGWAELELPDELIPGYYIDVDSDDSFLSLPVPRYDGRSTEQDSVAVTDLISGAERGQVQLPTLPPLTDDA